MNHSNNIAGHFEPELQHTFLPGCRNCGGSHPLARKPKMPAETCPDCGEPAGEPGPTHTEAAVIGNAPSMLFGRTLMFLGKKLSNLAKRI